jgi:Rrf2 family protein
MFSSTAEYALRAAVFLAGMDGRAATSQQVAAATRVPAGYLSKVLQDLVRAGLVSSQRGPGGGFTLARPAEEVSALDVINAVDPLERISTCPLGIHGANLCPLHRRLDKALELVEEALGASTIAEMVERPRGSSCKFPAAPVALRTTR